MKKVYEASPKDIIDNPELLFAFMEMFSPKDRLQLASMCIMFNCKSKYPEIEHNLKDNKDKVFKHINYQLNYIEKALKTSYNEFNEK